MPWLKFYTHPQATQFMIWVDHTGCGLFGLQLCQWSLSDDEKSLQFVETAVDEVNVPSIFIFLRQDLSV